MTAHWGRMQIRFINVFTNFPEGNKAIIVFSLSEKCWETIILKLGFVFCFCIVFEENNSWLAPDHTSLDWPHPHSPMEGNNHWGKWVSTVVSRDYHTYWSLKWSCGNWVLKECFRLSSVVKYGDDYCDWLQVRMGKALLGISRAVVWGMSIQQIGVENSLRPWGGGGIYKYLWCNLQHRQDNGPLWPS